MSKNKYDQHEDEISNEISIINKIEKLSRKMDDIRISEYIEMASNPKKLIFINFIVGLTRGLGMGIGFTVLAGIVLYIMQSWVNLPLVGKLIADLLDIIDAYR